MPISKKEDAINAVIQALGKHKKFSKDKKQAFADAIVSEIWFSYNTGKGRAEQAKNFRELRRRLNHARKAMTSLYRTIGGIGIDAEYIDSMAVAELRERGIDASQYLFQDYIDTFEKIMLSLRPAKPKPGRSNLSSLVPAKMIAAQYHKHFGEFPAYTNSAGDFETKETPYGRVCSTIKEFFDIKITSHAQMAAIKRIKEINS